MDANVSVMNKWRTFIMAAAGFINGTEDGASDCIGHRHPPGEMPSPLLIALISPFFVTGFLIWSIESLIVYCINKIRRKQISWYAIGEAITELPESIFDEFSDEFQEDLFIHDIEPTEYEQYVFYKFYIIFARFGKRSEYDSDDYNAFEELIRVRDEAYSNHLIIKLAKI